MHVTVLAGSHIRQNLRFGPEAFAAADGRFSSWSQGGAAIPPVVSFLVPEQKDGVSVRNAHMGDRDSSGNRIASADIVNQQLDLLVSSRLMTLDNATATSNPPACRRAATSPRRSWALTEETRRATWIGKPSSPPFPSAPASRDRRRGNGIPVGHGNAMGTPSLDSEV